MQARDVMQTTVITAAPETTVREIAKRLLENRISALPIVDDGGRLVGIVSEGDLMRRPELATDRHPSWWLSLIASPEQKAFAYVKEHGRSAKDVMTRRVITVNEDASLEQIAETLEKHRKKRVPAMESSQGSSAGPTSCTASSPARLRLFHRRTTARSERRLRQHCRRPASAARS